MKAASRKFHFVDEGNINRNWLEINKYKFIGTNSTTTVINVTHLFGCLISIKRTGSSNCLKNILFKKKGKVTL